MKEYYLVVNIDRKKFFTTKAETEEEAKQNIKDIFLKEHNLRLFDAEISFDVEPNIDYYELANLYISHFIDGLGIIETIGFLYSRGYTKEQLIALDFYEDDIDEAIKIEEEEE